MKKNLNYILSGLVLISLIAPFVYAARRVITESIIIPETTLPTIGEKYEIRAHVSTGLLKTWASTSASWEHILASKGDVKTKGQIAVGDGSSIIPLSVGSNDQVLT